MGYYIGSLLVENGEYESYEYMIFDTLENPNEYMEKMASTWYGNATLQYNTGRYLFDGGQVAVSVYRVKKISKNTYEELSDFI